MRPRHTEHLPDVGGTLIIRAAYELYGMEPCMFLFARHRSPTGRNTNDNEVGMTRSVVQAQYRHRAGLSCS